MDRDNLSFEESVMWLRQRAIDARAELAQTRDPDMRKYWNAVAHQADAEASARQQSVDRWKQEQKPSAEIVQLRHRMV